MKVVKRKDQFNYNLKNINYLKYLLEFNTCFIFYAVAGHCNTKMLSHGYKTI